MKEGRENEVAKILIKLPTLIRKFSLAWGCKKKRSSIALRQPFSFAPLKRKREQYLQIIGQLTKDNHLLYEQINNVNCYFHKLKDFNFKLKARKQELAHHPPITAGPAQICGVASFSIDVSPNGIPDLNLPLHESLMTMDFGEALDVNKNLSRAMAAQARQNRLNIYRFKNSIASVKPRYSCRS